MKVYQSIKNIKIQGLILKKKNIFDKIIFLTLLSMLFTIGYHIGSVKDTSIKQNAEITLKLDKLKGAPKENELIMIDGKYECFALSFEEDEINLLCQGYYTEAGFLFSGCKYLSKNQPIKASFPSGYLEGRIQNITFLSD